VTGTHAVARHLGNATVGASNDLAAMVTPESTHVANLDGRFEPSGYLRRTSDIVALMVLEHQATMLNLITRVGWEQRAGEAAAGRPLRAAAAELVDYLLFVDEAPVPGPIVGSGRFADTFAARGPRDSRGRSLRELDLKTRLARYSCSYLIYSDAFRSLPAEARGAVYARMSEILSGEERDPRYRTLSPVDREAVTEILRDTVPDLPPGFGVPAGRAAAKELDR